MALVVDASVATLLFLDEARSEAADRAMRESAETLIAPDVLPIEVANALWKARRLSKGGVVLEPILARLARAIAYEPSAKLLPGASKIAHDLDHPIYDCLYLALTEQGDHNMITADQRLVRKLQQTPFARRLTLLKADG